MCFVLLFDGEAFREQLCALFLIPQQKVFGISRKKFKPGKSVIFKCSVTDARSHTPMEIWDGRRSEHVKEPAMGASCKRVSCDDVVRKAHDGVGDGDENESVFIMIANK